MQHLPETGLGNPVTAVLIAYRAFDTMLEKVVLVLAVVGVWSLAADRYWGGAPGEARAERPEPTLAFLAQVLAPLGILVGVHVFWVGADEPGGAFQGGAILAAMWMIVMMARLTEAPRDERPLAAARAHRGAARVSRRGRRGRGLRGGIFRLSAGVRQAGDPVHRGVHGPLHRRDSPHAGGRVRRDASLGDDLGDAGWACRGGAGRPWPLWPHRQSRSRCGKFSRST